MNSNDKTQLGSGSSNYRNKADQLQAGTIIDNRYEIKEKLGSGGFGAVYKVWDKQLELDKAIKVIHPDFYDEEMVMEKLKKETRLMMRLNVPEVVRVYDVQLDGEINYISMEFLDGEDLATAMAKREKLPETEVLALSKKIATGMAQVHQENVLHLDLKPANVRITSRGQVKILDFGIAQALKTGTKSRLNETSKSGTMAYMSPEQIIGLKVGKESDIWAFGIMIYQMLTGEMLYNAPSFRDLDFQMEKRPFLGDEDLSEKMNVVLKGCLAYDYKKRFRTFEEVLGAIQNSEKITIVEIKEPNYEPIKREEPKPETVKKVESPKVIAEVKQPEIIDKLKDAPKEITNSIGMQFVLIPAGTFMMGSNENGSEKPIHEVRISQSFYLGKYLVTQKEWTAIMGNNPSSFKGENRPVVSVSWNDVQEFIQKLNQKEGGNKYCLPTEAEWEYSARAGTNTKWSFGDNESQLGEYAWYDKNSKTGFTFLSRETHPVGKKKPNGFELYDMHGQVWEWCSDWYDGEYYKNSPNIDPLGPDTGSDRVYRGGGWLSYAEFTRSACRGNDSPGHRYDYIGFRLLRLQ